MELRINPLNVDMIAPSVKNYLNPDQGGSKIVVIGKPGCFERGTKVQVVRGGDPDLLDSHDDYPYLSTKTKTMIKNIENIDLNDILIGDQRQPQKVLDTCQGMSYFYTIYNSITRETLVRVNEEHILTLYCCEIDCIVDISLLDYIQKLSKVSHCMWMRVITNEKGEEQTMYEEFEVEPDGYRDYYFGVVLGGNHRFRLADGSIVHNTGKTTLITSLLYEKSNIFPTALIMSGTEDSNGHYKRLIPSTFVYNHMHENKIEDFVARQKIAKKHLTNPWSVLLLDDCTDDPKVLNKPIFQGLYKNGRHWKMWFVLSLQYCMDIKPVIRTNIDGTFILRESNLRNRKTLWENYAGIIPDFALFCQIMDTITDDYTALYIHNATQSNRIEDCVFWYKAKPVPKDFRFGSRDFWRFHKQRYDDNYTESFRF